MDLITSLNSQYGCCFIAGYIVEFFVSSLATDLFLKIILFLICKNDNKVVEMGEQCSDIFLNKNWFPQGCLKNRERNYPDFIDMLRKFSSKTVYFPARGFCIFIAITIICTPVRLNSYFIFFFLSNERIYLKDEVINLININLPTVNALLSLIFRDMPILLQKNLSSLIKNIGNKTH